jgi:hypothetical protein
VARAVGVELEEETMKLARANIAKLRPELASKVWPAELRARAQLCLVRAFSSCACPPAVPADACCRPAGQVDLRLGSFLDVDISDATVSPWTACLPMPSGWRCLRS